MLVILGTIDVHPDDTEKVVALANPLVEQTVTEQGCHIYAFSVDTLTPGRVRIAEYWESEADLQAHLRTPQVAAFVKALGSLRVTGGDSRQFEVSSVGPVNIPEM